jgi:uncharacterized protein YbjT (DUF2867 family)
MSLHHYSIKMEKRKALIFGSTGLIGNLLLKELVSSEIYSGIRIFVRQPAGTKEPKVEEVTIDFSALDIFSKVIMGDDLFICVGTTIKKAGSVKKMEEIDRDLPVRIASIASTNGVKRVAVVSSLGASASSQNYYLRIKGEMEDGIMKQNFETIAVVRPSMLLGERKEKRAGETAGKIIMKIFRPLLTGKLRKYRAIHGRDVARAMIAILQKDHVKNIYESDELQKIADKYQM